MQSHMVIYDFFYHYPPLTNRHMWRAVGLRGHFCPRKPDSDYALYLFCTVNVSRQDESKGC